MPLLVPWFLVPIPHTSTPLFRFCQTECGTSCDSIGINVPPVFSMRDTSYALHFLCKITDICLNIDIIMRLFVIFLLFLWHHITNWIKWIIVIYIRNGNHVSMTYLIFCDFHWWFWWFIFTVRLVFQMELSILITP